MMRLKVLGIAAALAGGLGLATAANALPFAPGPVGLSEGDARIEQVRDGCGWGAARNYYGECRFGRSYNPYGYGGGYGVYGGYGGGYYRPRPRPYYGGYGPPPVYGYGPRPFF